MTQEKSAATRAALALQGAGLSPDQANAAISEVKAEVYREVYKELRYASAKKNPYLLPWLRRAWSAGMLMAMDLVFSRVMRADARTRYFRRPPVEDISL